MRGDLPADITETTRENPRRCWRCDFYKSSYFASEDNNSGKCYRGENSLHGVSALLTCNRFRYDGETA